MYLLLVLIRRNVEGPAGRTNGCGTERNGSLFAPQLVEIAVLFTHWGRGWGWEGKGKSAI